MNPGPNNRASGFAAREAIIVVAVICLLLAIFVIAPVYSAAKQVAIRSRCLNNVKQLAQGTIFYPFDSTDSLPPAPAGGPHWPWDLDWGFIYLMTDIGCTRDMMYDPGVPKQNDDKLWNQAPGIFRTLGYAYAFGGTNSTVKPPDQIISFWDKDSATGLYLDASRRVVVADALITPAGQDDPAEWKSYNWTKITNGTRVFTSSLHSLRRNANLPRGGNVGFLDCHAKWFPWSNQIPRTTGTNGTAIFWW